MIEIAWWGLASYGFMCSLIAYFVGYYHGKKSHD